ncbi:MULTISPECIES: acyl carrier protein phosphodiesterase [unclassified Saccharicrinis]|uniref:acyl carrier protein phosphodiesterase n=1 Tax=unclassified Saccharicrinis TaxID=2646859 RepID=UPI003D34A2AA
MNFLAHIYLSGEPGPLMIGNFIGDYVKGNQLERFSPEIQKGIRLHRTIDAFTDSHEIVKQSTARFKPCYQRYASVVIDVIYDHYLAHNWEKYSSVPLHQYVNQVHAYFFRHYFSLPNRVKGFLPFLIKSRRLENYKYIWGIETSLAIMANYSSLPAKSECAVKVMTEQYDALLDEFTHFFDDVQKMVKVELQA